METPPNPEEPAENLRTSVSLSIKNQKDSASKIPDWINEENFQSVLEQNVADFKKIINFEVKETGGGGENYASMMMRVQIQVELEDGSSKDVAFMIKIIPPGDQGATIVNMMGFFPKETLMYGKYLRHFEEMYRSIGKEITFGAQFYQLKNDPGVEYVLLEDVSQRGFKNLNRLDGLDEEHTKSVLKLLAELHAVSAVYFEQRGPYEESIMKSPFNEDTRDQLETMLQPLLKILSESFAKHPIGTKYLSKLQPRFDKLIEGYINDSKIDFNDFNVVLHGDLWTNNIMFRHNNEGENLQQTIFVDYQASRYGSPIVDLFYFLLSSPRLDFKISCFDDFVKYYHEHLVENLKLLNYPKKLPTMKHLRMSFLRYNSWGISTIQGILSAILLDPTKNADINKFFEENEEANDFRTKLYENPRYIEHLQIVLPWMERMGYLDES